MRVVVAGWIGSTNLGDELVLWALLRKLRDRASTIVAVSTDPATTQVLHGIAAVDHRRVDLLDKYLASADALLFGGGGLLQDETSRFNLPYHLSRVALARGNGAAVAMVGMGAGPLTTVTGRAMVRGAFAGTVLGSVRDRDSGQVLAELGLPRPQLAADLALSLPSPEVDRQDRVAVCLRPWHGGGLPPVSGTWRRGLRNEWFAQSMAEALDEIADATGLDIHLVAFQAGRDDEMGALVADRMVHTPTVATPTLATVLDEVAASRAVVSLRYHGAIAATLAGLPSVLIGYSDKVRSLAADLGQGSRGLGWSPDEVASLPQALEDILGREDAVYEALWRLRVRELGNDDAIDRALAVKGVG